MNQNIIEVKNMLIKYGRQKIVKNINFNIKKGEFVSLIGPNGAGKSTILKGLNKNLDLTDGEIYLKNKALKNYSYKDKAKIIGFVPQEFNITFDFTVLDIVSMGRNPYTNRFGRTTQKDDLIIDEVLKKTNTYSFRNKSFKNLSGGEKQRVIIARALAQEPEILILDEATSNLDMHHQLDILELIYWLNREESITVVSVMHDLNMAARFSDRLILLNSGTIVKDGTPDEVLQEDIIQNIYNIETIIKENKLLSCKEIIPLRIRRAHEDKNIRIHVICGGGTGEYIIQKLYSQRYIISAGILNEGDSDLELCKNLNIDYVSENPFSYFTKESIKKCCQYIKVSDIIIVTDVAVGRGNFDNIKMIENITNKRIIILHSVNRDFVNGEYEDIIDKLRQCDNVTYAMNLKELFENFE